jgi:hypothetical protein
MPLDRRQLCDKLRQELGITEEWNPSGGRATGVEIGMAGEFRAFREAVRLSLKQIEARFKVPRGTLNYWLKQETKAPIYANEAIAKKLIEALQKARDMKLTTPDPGAGKAKRVTKTRRGVGQRAWRCTQCGESFREKALTNHGGDFVHALPEGGEATGFCGPVVFADRDQLNGKTQEAARCAS